MRRSRGVGALRLALGVAAAVVAVAAVAPSAFAAPPPPGPLSAAPNPFDFLVKPSVGTVLFTNTTGAPVQVTAVNTYSAPAVPSVDFTVQIFTSSCSLLPRLLPAMWCTVDVVVQLTAVAGQHARRQP